MSPYINRLYLSRSLKGWVQYGGTAKMGSVRRNYFPIVGWTTFFLKNAKKCVILKTFDLTFMECDIYLYGLLLILIASGEACHILLLRNWQFVFEKLKKIRQTVT